MKKFLRYYLVILMALFCGTMMAQTTIWSEDWSGYQANDVPSKNNTNYSQVDGASATKIYDENLAGGTKPELLIGKTGSGKTGSFTAKIALNGATGEMNLAYKANYDRITVSASPSSVTLGEKTKSGNDYLIPVTVPSGVSEIELTFTNSNSSNVRFDNVKLYQGTAKKPAGLSWGTASRSVTIGADDNVFPTLTNENNLTVVYSSSETSVATINVNGEITLVAAGETKITASFAGNDEYESGEVSYTLTVKESSGGTTSTEITVAKALEITNALENGKTTTEEYKVKGFIVGTPDFQRKTDGSLYGNVNLTIADEKGGTSTLTIYHGKYIGNVLFTEQTITTIKEGDEVVFQGKLQKYVKDEVITPELTSCYLISVNGNTEPQTPEITIGEASDINEFKNQPKDKPYKLTLENAQVVYAWTSSNGNVQAYVRDETGALCFFFAKGYETVSDKFAVNNILNGSIVMQSNSSQTRADAIEQSKENTITSTAGSEAEPVKINAADISKNLYDLVLLENVTIEEKDGKYYVGDIQLYNGMYNESFDTEKKENFSAFVGEGKNVKGIAVVYNTTYEIYPIEITSAGGGEQTGSTIYSWSADSEGNITEIGGKAVATDGQSVGFSNKGYTTIRVSTKKANVDTENIEITLDNALEKGDVITVTGYKNKNEDGKLVSLFIKFEKGEPYFNDEETWVNICDENGTDFDNDGNTPNTNTYTVAEDAAGSKTIKLSRSKASTNLYITSFVITRGGSTGIENTIVKPAIENGIRYNLAGQRVDENYKGVVIMNGKKYVVK